MSNVNEILKKLGVSEDKANVFDGYKLFTESEHLELLNNIRKDAGGTSSKEAYDEGYKAGEEKQLRKSKAKLSEQGYDLEGKKTFDEIFNELIQIERGKLNIQESEQVKGLTDKYNSLKNDFSSLQTTLEQEKNKFEEEKKLMKKQFNRERMSSKIKGIANTLEFNLPDNLKSLDDPKLINDYYTKQRKLFEAVAYQEYDFDINDEGQEIVLKNGEIVKNNVHSPETPENILKTLQAEYFPHSQSKSVNREKPQNKKGRFKTKEDVHKYCEANNIQMNSPEGVKLFVEFAKESENG